MTTRGPEPNDPLSPYDPSAVPDVPGNGRPWIAILVSAALVLGAVYALLTVALAV